MTNRFSDNPDVTLWVHLDIISYKKLWKLLIDLDIKKKDLQQTAGVSSALIAKMGRNENVSTDSLVKICTALNCDIGDIIEIVPTVRAFLRPSRGDGALPGLLFSLPLSGFVPVIQRSGATKNLSSWGRKIPRQARDDTGRSE